MPSARAESPAPAADHLPARSFSLPACWQYLKQISCVFSFFAAGLAVSPFCGLLWRCFGNDIPPTFGQRLIRGLFNGWLQVSSRIGIFDIRFPEAEKLRDLRATVLAPNHPSLIDAVILLSIVPNTVCIMRANLIESPFLGGAARLAGFVPNDKGPALVRHGIEKIRVGENLLIFPEGTRTEAQAINSFKHGFALIAKKTGRRFKPYLSNAKDVIFPRAWRYYLLGGLRSDFDCISGNFFALLQKKVPSNSRQGSSATFASTLKIRAKTFAWSGALESPACARRPFASGYPAQLQ